jgi:hypothetical protein
MKMVRCLRTNDRVRLLPCLGMKDSGEGVELPELRAGKGKTFLNTNCNPW